MQYTNINLIALYCILIKQTSALNFSNYPSKSRQSLENAFQTSECPRTEEFPLQDLNTCLCTNGGNFLGHTARFLRYGHRPLVEEVWNTLVLDCEKSGTPIQYSVAQFLQLGLGMQHTEKDLFGGLGGPWNVRNWPKWSYVLFKVGIACAIAGFMLYVAVRLIETGKFGRWSGVCWRWLWNQAG
jgi:hypothetical protein